MANILFLFTSTFPFGLGETFIENEINYLASGFDKVVIVTNNCQDTESRYVPENCVVERMTYQLNLYQKLKSFGGVFSKLFWSELHIIRKHYVLPITLIVINTMLSTLQKSKVFQKNIKALTSKHSQTNDSVFFYTYWANDITFAIAQLSSISNCKKKISRAHRWDIYFEANKSKYLPFRYFMISAIDKLSFISDDGLSYYKNLFPTLSEKLDVARLGVLPQNTIAYNGSETLRIVSCSSLVLMKRVDLIIESLSHIRSFKIEWTHLGGGVLFDYINNLCPKKLHSANISFNLRGNMTNSAVLEFYKTTAVDCFINVSSSEGIPVSIMEAMSFGIPVIATAVGGTPEIVNFQNGYLIDKDISAQAIAKVIEQFHNLSKTEKRSMRHAAYNTWNEKYNAEKNYTNFVNNLLDNNT